MTVYDDPLVVASLAMAGSVVTGAVMATTSAVLNNWQANKRETRAYARQDTVAEAVRETARQAKLAAAIAAEQGNILVLSNQDIEKKVDVVHGLVNSALTTVKQAEYDGLVRELALTRRNQVLGARLGDTISKEDKDYAEVLEAKIGVLKIELAGRTRQVVVLPRQAEEAAAEVAKDTRRRAEDLGG